MSDTVTSVISRARKNVPAYDTRTHRNLDDLTRLAEPGTRLWILPAYGAAGYYGLGEPATATGLAQNAAEALFGEPAKSWLVGFVTDSGHEGRLATLAVSTLADARTRWWITDGRGNLVSGGHPDRDRMETLAYSLTIEHGQARRVQPGTDFIPES